MEHREWTREKWNAFRDCARNERGSAMWREMLRVVQWAGNKNANSNFRLHGNINGRAMLWDEINEHAVDGRVGMIQSGMDCDCSSYHYEGIIDVPKGALIHQKEVEGHEAYLEGPETIRYVRPHHVNQDNNGSRDLALEAFEDGHPHVVYW